MILIDFRFDVINTQEREREREREGGVVGRMKVGGRQERREGGREGGKEGGESKV